MLIECVKRMCRVDSQKKGFTLIEVLVAISVIATVGFIPISIVTQHVIQGALTPDRVKAELLTQEIIEYVRHDRDLTLLTALDPNANTDGWFADLYKLESDYKDCVVYTDDWVADIANTSYCTVVCSAVEDANAEPDECGTTDGGLTYDGFVVGIASGGIRGSDTKTCDGKSAERGFTTTLNLVVPREEDGVRHVAIAPCVSWEEKNGSIRKTTLRETIFEWIQRR